MRLASRQKLLARNSGVGVGVAVKDPHRRPMKAAVDVFANMPRCFVIPIYKRGPHPTEIYERQADSTLVVLCSMENQQSRNVVDFVFFFIFLCRQIHCLGVTSMVSFFVEYNVRKQPFNTLGMA